MKIIVDKLHITESLTRLGGVETLVHQLLQGDESSYGAALLDPPETGIDKGIGLRAGRHAGANMIRHAASNRFAGASHLVFHNFAGLMMLSGVVPHRRKCLFLHTNSADVFSILPERLPYLDTILVSGKDLENELHERFPQINVPITAVEYPLDDRYFEAHQRMPSPSLVLGYSGRLEVEQKQVLRLVELCRTLTILGLHFRLEIAGGGNALGELQRYLPAAHCCFLGVLAPAELHAAYKRWDFLICTSDYETGPLVAMEAMASGVIPILPNIPCQATELIKDLDLTPYPRGDMAAASRLIQKLTGDRELERLRKNLIAQVANRRITSFVDKINRVLEESAMRPALSKTPAVPSGLAEYLPFALRRLRNTHLR